jgi:hypothetical protein
MFALRHSPRARSGEVMLGIGQEELDAQLHWPPFSRMAGNHFITFLAKGQSF